MSSFSATTIPASWIAATNLNTLNPGNVAYFDGAVALVDQPCTLVGYQLSCRFTGGFSAGLDNSDATSYFSDVDSVTNNTTFTTTALRLRLENLPSSDAAGDPMTNQRVVWFGDDGIYFTKLYIHTSAGSTGILGTPGLTITAFYKLQPTA